MKKHTLLILVLAGITAFFSCNKSKETIDVSMMPCIPDSLGTNIIAFYPFSNGSLNDFSGNGNNLSNTTTAQPGPDRNGNPSCAYHFHNDSLTSEWLSLGNTAFLNNLTAFSVSLWYKPEDSSRHGGIYEVLIKRGTQTTEQWALALFDCRKPVFNYCNSVWDTNMTVFNDTSGLNCTMETQVRTGSWRHLVVTYSSAANEIRLYRDGILRDNVSGASCQNPLQNIGDLLLGNGYTGMLDDVILFNKTLDASEVTQLYSMEPCCAP